MNFKENKPIYLQIADRIMDEILCNVYREEERIPSVREYAATVEVREKIIALRRESFLNESLPEMFRQMQLLDIPVSEISALYQQFLKENK